MRFTQFREYNDNEGEVWHFWLQFDGNLKELEKLEDLIDRYEEVQGSDSDYTLTGEVLDERDVNLLMKFGEDGYMSQHNKVTGRFTCPEFTNFEDWEAFENLFYKGGIAEHFEEV